MNLENAGRYEKLADLNREIAALIKDRPAKGEEIRDAVSRFVNLLTYDEKIVLYFLADTLSEASESEVNYGSE